MQDLFAALVSFFLIQPIQAELTEKLEVARVPQSVIADVTACGRTATPLVLDRVISDPVWSLSSAVRAWTGTTRPEALLLEVAPGCASALSSARPFLEGRGA